MVSNIGRNAEILRRDLAAYTHLTRVLNDEETGMPIITWHCRDADDGVVTVESDLSLLDRATGDRIITALINAHVNGLAAAAAEVVAQGTMMVRLIRASQEAVTAAPAPAPALQGDQPNEPNPVPEPAAPQGVPAGARRLGEPVPS
jgi:hypothetical protein